MASKDEGFLSRAYDLEESKDTKAFYREWAASYEEEVRANGYVTPERCAEALAGLVANKNGALLDLGCGTGLSGEAFRDAGFLLLDGSDFSEDMLSYAREKEGLYRHLILGDLNNPIPARPGDYDNIAAVGVFSPGHAPPEMIAEVMTLLPSGGCFVFSLNDHALADAGYEAAIEELTAASQAEVLFKDYGPHLPAKEIKATVYVLRKR